MREKRPESTGFYLKLHRVTSVTANISLKAAPSPNQSSLLKHFLKLKMCFCFENLPLNCISHSLTLSICTAFKSDRSSYSSLSASLSRQKVASPLEASLPANIPYGPSENKKRKLIPSSLCLEWPVLVLYKSAKAIHLTSAVMKTAAVSRLWLLDIAIQA